MNDIPDCSKCKRCKSMEYLFDDFIVVKKTNHHKYMDCLVYIVHQKSVLYGVQRK